MIVFTIQVYFFTDGAIFSDDTLRLWNRCNPMKLKRLSLGNLALVSSKNDSSHFLLFQDPKKYP